MTLDLKNKKIWIAGHSGMVGSALIRRLSHEQCMILTIDHKDMDLTDQHAVDNWVAKHKPDIIFLAAAKVGGILANATYPVDFLQINLMIQNNIISTAHRNNVEKLVFLASACMYPRNASQPMTEETIMTGELEPTNEAYAIAKIAGTKLCQAYRKQYDDNFITVVPTNSYGPNDNFCLETGHVPAAIMVKAHTAKIETTPTITLWGNGQALRDFIYVDDMADAIVFAARHYNSDSPLNIGSGTETSIAELAEVIKDAVGYKGNIVYDTTKPNGAPRKHLDCQKLNQLGWQASTELEIGFKKTYKWFCQNNIKKQT